MNKKTQKVELNIVPFLAEAFSVNSKIYKNVDKIYNQNKFKYINIAKENEYYNHPMAQEGNIEQEYYFKKSLGIILASQNSENIGKEIFNIIKKGWKYAWTYIQNHNIISISQFLDNFVKKKKGLDNISDDEFNANTLIVIFLAYHLEKEIDTEDEIYNDFINNLLKRLEHYKGNYRISIDDLPKQRKKKLRELELKIKNNSPISFIPSSFRLSNEQVDGMLVDYNRMTKDEKYFSAFEYIFDLEQMSLISVVGKDYLKSKDVQELIFCYSQLYEDEDDLDFNELQKFLYPAIQMLYLCKEYMKAKKYFFNNFDEELYEEISKVENENRDLKKRDLLLQDENEGLKRELEQLQKENKRLKQDLKESQQNKTELISLREFLFDLDKEIDYVDNKKDYSKLNEIKGVIVGGTPNWQQRMKERLDNWNFINVDNINFDDNIIKNSDTVVFYINYLSHALYYRVIDIANKNNIKVMYINNNQNIDIVLNQLLDKIGE